MPPSQPPYVTRMEAAAYKDQEGAIARWLASRVEPSRRRQRILRRYNYHADRLRPLERIWQVIPHQKAIPGGDPNAGRVPDGVVSLLTKEEQLAARLVDVLLGANISVLKLAMVETEPEMSQRLTAFLADFPFLHEIFDVGVEAVLVAAELTPRQREAYYMHLQGATDNDIALFMGLHPSTVRVYVSDGHLKLRELPGEIGV